MPTVEIKGNNTGNVAGRDVNQVVLTSDAIFAMVSLGFLKKATNDSRIVSVNDITDSKKVLMHLSWMRFGLFSLAFLMSFVFATAATSLEPGSLAGKSLFVTSVVFYVLAFIPALLKGRVNGWLLRYVY